MSTPNEYSLAVLLDAKRLESIKRTNLEHELTNMFGGAVKAFIMKVPQEQSKRLLAEFPRARIDARGFLEELPVAFKRALFDEIVRSDSIGEQSLNSVLNKINEIRKAAENEEEYLPPPLV